LIHGSIAASDHSSSCVKPVPTNVVAPNKLEIVSIILLLIQCLIQRRPTIAAMGAAIRRSPLLMLFKTAHSPPTQFAGGVTLPSCQPALCSIAWSYSFYGMVIRLSVYRTYISSRIHLGLRQLLASSSRSRPAAICRSKERCSCCSPAGFAIPTENAWSAIPPSAVVAP